MNFVTVIKIIQAACRELKISFPNMSQFQPPTFIKILWTKDERNKKDKDELDEKKVAIGK
jgi:hypothetical protein